MDLLLKGGMQEEAFWSKGLLEEMSNNKAVDNRAAQVKSYWAKVSIC